MVQEKETIISQIKAIIHKHGSFNTLAFGYSPCVETVGNLVASAEEFNQYDVKVNVYNPTGFSSDAIDSYFKNYEELSVEVLREILALCEQHAKNQ